MLFYMKASEEGFRPGSAPDEINPYTALGVSSSAPQTEIRKVYKKLAIQFHPDKNPDCGERCVQRFDEISKAFEKVGDPVKRAAFDSNKGVSKDVLGNAA